MKEKIYTIPINESFEQDCECPFCFIEKNLEIDAVNYALGAAMMEPDYRILSNEKGYCNKHFSMMLSAGNKLSLALVLETHLSEIITKIEQHSHKLAPTGKKKLFMTKKNSTDYSVLVNELSNTQKSCVICDKISETIERYIDVFFYMWQKDDELKNKVLSSKGFCLKHFSKLCEASLYKLKNPEDFISTIYNLEIDNLKRISEDIHKFTLKFDYRNKDMQWGTAEDAPIRTIEKLRGYTIPIKD